MSEAKKGSISSAATHAVELLAVSFAGLLGIATYFAFYFHETTGSFMKDRLHDNVTAIAVREIVGGCRRTGSAEIRSE
jgi:hypothetical protein